MTICILVTDRADASPLTSVCAALPDAHIIDLRHIGGYPAAARAAKAMKVTERELPASARVLVILGDRYEALAAAQVATLRRVKIAHIHGGEVTAGAMDDKFRDCISRLTGLDGLHFCATNRAWERLIEFMGAREGYATVAFPYENFHMVGAPGLDGIEQNSAKRDRNMLLATFHPETRAKDFGMAALETMLAEIALFDGEIIFTGVNQDPGAEVIRERIERFVMDGSQTKLIISGMSRETYIAKMQMCLAVIGNSSAGIIEAPWVGVPSVNYGGRQEGRECAASVRLTLSEALAFTGTPDPIYRGGGVGKKIAEIIRERYS